MRDKPESFKKSYYKFTMLYKKLIYINILWGKI